MVLQPMMLLQSLQDWFSSKGKGSRDAGGCRTQRRGWKLDLDRHFDLAVFVRKNIYNQSRDRQTHVQQEGWLMI